MSNPFANLFKGKGDDTFQSPVPRFIPRLSIELSHGGYSEGLIFSYFLEQADFYPHPEVGTMLAQISRARAIFFYNPTVNFSYEEFKYLVMSEIYKILYRHPSRYNDLNASKEEMDALMVSSEVSMRDYISRNHGIKVKNLKNLPLLPNPSEFGIKPGDSMEEIFEILRQVPDQVPQQGNNYDKLQSDAKQKGENGEGKGEGEGEGEGEGKDGEGEGNSNGNQSNGQGQGQSENSPDKDSHPSEKEQQQREQELEDFLSQLADEIQLNTGQSAEKLSGNDSELQQSFRGRGLTSGEPEFGDKVTACPTMSRAWTRLVKWELKKKRAMDIDFHNQWAVTNPRIAAIQDPDICLPSDRLILESSYSPGFWVFLDISGSCHHMAPQFFQVLKSIPNLFTVRSFLFDTGVVEIDFRKMDRVTHGGGTSFDCIEMYIRRTCAAENIPYPDYVVVITDGEGGSVSPEFPERWCFILSAGSAYADQVLATVTIDGRQHNISVDDNKVFIRSKDKRKKRFPVALSLEEFTRAKDGIMVSYEYRESP